MYSSAYEEMGGGDAPLPVPGATHPHTLVPPSTGVKQALKANSMNNE